MITAATFLALHPKPWTYTCNEVTITLRDANGKTLGAFHPSVKGNPIPHAHRIVILKDELQNTKCNVLSSSN